MKKIYYPLACCLIGGILADEIVVSGEFEDNWTPKTGDANVENDKK